MTRSCVVLLVAPAFLLACQGKDSTPRSPSPVTGILPLTTVQAADVMLVPVALSNATGGPIKYAVAADGVALYHLQGSLHREGKTFEKGLVHVDEAEFNMNQVRVLPAGSAAVLKYRLPYVKLEPGLYELRLTYQIHAKSVDDLKHGLTPMKHEQTVYLDVAAK